MDERTSTRTGRPKAPGAILHHEVSDARSVPRGIG